MKTYKEFLFEGLIDLAPNGEQTNLTPIQYKIVRTPEFKSWFGDWENNPDNSGKVVDENGEPLVVYHRTYYDFFEFDKTKGMKNFYFSDDRYGYISYGDKEIEAFINLRNPTFEVNKGGKFILDGYDGVILKHDRFGEKETVVIARESNQIKLANGKNLSFTDSNDIRL